MKGAFIILCIVIVAFVYLYTPKHQDKKTNVFIVETPKGNYEEIELENLLYAYLASGAELHFVGNGGNFVKGYMYEIID